MRNKLSKSPSNISLTILKQKKRYKSGFYLLTCFEVLNVNSTFATKKKKKKKKKRKPENDIYILPFVCFFLLVAQTDKNDISFSQINEICF